MEDKSERTTISLPTYVYEKLKKAADLNKRTMVSQIDMWSDKEVNFFARGVGALQAQAGDNIPPGYDSEGNIKA